LPIKTRIENKLHQVRILPKGECYVVEIIYSQEICDLKLDRNQVIGIDLGLSNLVTIVNNTGLSPFVLKGGVVKSVNQYYNKQLAKFRSTRDQQGYRFTTKRLHRLSLKRSNKLKDIFHKTSRFIVDFCVKNNIGTIVVGYNREWKQNINLGRRNNQRFVQVPFARLVHMVCYKAKLLGVDVIVTGESYTSKCSFLDRESVESHEEYLGKRVSRGLYRSAKGRLINADVNGAYNIISKVVPKAFAVDGIEALGLMPQSITIT
jgi:putative transposase